MIKYIILRKTYLSFPTATSIHAWSNLKKARCSCIPYKLRNSKIFLSSCVLIYSLNIFSHGYKSQNFDFLGRKQLDTIYSMLLCLIKLIYYTLAELSFYTEKIGASFSHVE